MKSNADDRNNRQQKGSKSCHQNVLRMSRQGVNLTTFVAVHFAAEMVANGLIKKPYVCL